MEIVKHNTRKTNAPALESSGIGSFGFLDVDNNSISRNINAFSEEPGSSDHAGGALNGLSIENDDSKAKTSLRMLYEAQVKVIKDQIGGLEEVRAKLQLSQRKVCQLLMVDPSAWTRWVKNGQEAPPHIYRALQWFFIIQDKIPGLTAQYFTGKDSNTLYEMAVRKIEASASLAEQKFLSQLEKLAELERQNRELRTEKEEIELRIQHLEAAIRAQRASFFMLAIAALIFAGAIYFIFLRAGVRK